MKKLKFYYIQSDDFHYLKPVDFNIQIQIKKSLRRLSKT